MTNHPSPTRPVSATQARLRTPDTDTDLHLDRLLAAPPKAVWRAWSEPQLLCQWFCPPPWRCVDATIDLTPGGAFITRMEGPDGATMESEGCFLVVVPRQMLIFTDALAAGFRPREQPFMTVMIAMAPEGEGTRYHVQVRHASSDARAQHEAMGFHVGWATAAAQLDTLTQRL